MVVHSVIQPFSAVLLTYHHAYHVRAGRTVPESTTPRGEHPSDSVTFHDQRLGTGQGGNLVWCQAAAIQPLWGPLRDESEAPPAVDDRVPESGGGSSNRDGGRDGGGNRDGDRDDR